MSKKKVNITLDEEILKILEKLRFEEKFKPSLSSVINLFLKENKFIKERLKQKWNP